MPVPTPVSPTHAFRPASPPAAPGLWHRVAGEVAEALAASFLAVAAGVPLRSAYKLIPDGDE
ncbi:hypothetical protein [Methylobacterium sp. SD21]|uniref:hypothetical protein n=1 Tax=Methylobacterium litchii TaxID=3138810 RepID=UPI00313E62AF